MCAVRAGRGAVEAFYAPIRDDLWALPIAEQHAELTTALRYAKGDGGIYNTRDLAPRARAGAARGQLAPSGYIVTNLVHRQTAAHRLAWFLVTGEWPDQIDHINGVRADNRWVNLRAVDSKTNSENNHVARGYHYHKAAGKYMARIRTNGVEHYLGLFSTPEEARAAYTAAKSILHPGAVL